MKSSSNELDMYLKTSSFTGNFGIEAAKTDGKCLKSRDRILIIHGKNILSDFPKLKDNTFMLRTILPGSNELKVLDRSNSYTTIKVKTPTLKLLMPSRSLVSQT